jgi:hypothetical protein
MNRNILPSTAKTHDVTSFDLGNVTATHKTREIETPSTSQNLTKSTLPVVKHREHMSKIKYYTNTHVNVSTNQKTLPKYLR